MTIPPMGDERLAADEARRLQQHQEVKREVESDVNRDVLAGAELPTIEERREATRAGRELRERAVNETVQTERELGRTRVMARVGQVVDYFFYVVYSLLAIRLVLGLMAANSANGFVRFIRAVTAPLYAPFEGIVNSPTAEGGFTLAWPIVIAIGVYMLLHAGIKGLLRLMAHRPTRV